MASHTFTRQELYDLVWSEPMIKLAARYKISGNGLAKACRKADIPVPERGYWNKVRAGRKVPKKPLPAAKAGTPGRITISPPVPLPEPPPPPPSPPSITERIDAERKAAKPLTVPATLSSPHRIVAAWLEEDRREARARRHDPYFSRLHTAIDKTDLDKRRLRILSALFKAIESRGYKLSVDDRNYRQSVAIESGDGTLGIDIHERIRQVRRRITDEERADRRRYFSVNQTWTQEKILTGELVLTIGGKEWSDAAESPLETKLDDVLPYLEGAFEELRLRRQREAEEQARRWKAEQERQRVAMERKKGNDTVPPPAWAVRGMARRGRYPRLHRRGGNKPACRRARRGVQGLEIMGAWPCGPDRSPAERGYVQP